MKITVGDKLVCKQEILKPSSDNIQIYGEFFINKPYKISFIDDDYIHMIAENGGVYLFFQDNYHPLKYPVGRHISKYFYTEKELRKLKLKNLEYESR